MLEKLTWLAVCYYSFGRYINIGNLFLFEITNRSVKTVHGYGEIRIFLTLDVNCKKRTTFQYVFPLLIIDSKEVVLPSESQCEYSLVELTSL